MHERWGELGFDGGGDLTPLEEIVLYPSKWNE